MSDRSTAGVEAVSGALVGLTAISLGLRAYVRTAQKQPLLADDWCMFLAFLAFVACAGSTIASQHHLIGYSPSIPESENEQLLDTLRAFLTVADAYYITAAICLGLTKASALFFYRRLFCTGIPLKHDKFHLTIIITLVVVACWTIIIVVFAALGQDIDIPSQWNYGILKTYFLKGERYQYPWYVSDFLLDLWVLLLPVSKILGIQTTLAKKLSIIGVFMLALVGLATSIARMTNFIIIKDRGYAAFEKSNPQAPVTELQFFLILELGMSLIAINLPTLWPLFSTSLPNAISRVSQRLKYATSERMTDDDNAHSLSHLKYHGSSGKMASKGTDDSAGAFSPSERSYDVSATEG